jgi:hypothetical protein
MGTIIVVSEIQFDNLLLGKEISILRKEPKEYAVTFAQVSQLVHVRYDKDQYSGVVTERIDHAISEYDVEIMLKLRLV